jgi:thymidylate kinase
MLVCFEGGDAAGKSTLAASVCEELRRRGKDPVLLDKKSADGFESPYLGQRMEDLRRVLWDYPDDAPLWEWGDAHWFHLIVSWFSVLDRCRVQPLLREGRCVVVDNWYYKFAARFLLKPDFERHLVLSSFRHLTEPDVVVFVDVDPRVAVTRRTAFSATESGRMDGYRKGGKDDFVEYQERVLESLRGFFGPGWVRLAATGRPLDALAEEASEILMAAQAQHSAVSGGQPWSYSPHLQAKMQRSTRMRPLQLAQLTLFTGTKTCAHPARASGAAAPAVKESAEPTEVGQGVERS